MHKGDSMKNSIKKFKQPKAIRGKMDEKTLNDLYKSFGFISPVMEKKEETISMSEKCSLCPIGKREKAENGMDCDPRGTNHIHIIQVNKKGKRVWSWDYLDEYVTLSKFYDKVEPAFSDALYEINKKKRKKKVNK